MLSLTKLHRTKLVLSSN